MTPRPAAQWAPLGEREGAHGAVSPQRVQSERLSQAAIRKIQVKSWLKNLHVRCYYKLPKHAAEPF